MISFIDFYNLLLGTKINSYDGLPYPVKKVHFKKGEVVIALGDIADAVYFINDGIIELTIKSYMSEKIIDFFFANEMVSVLTSFLTQEPSDVEVIALTDCEMEMITNNDLKKAYENSLEANKLARIIIEQRLTLEKPHERKIFWPRRQKSDIMKCLRTNRSTFPIFQ